MSLFTKAIPAQLTDVMQLCAILPLMQLPKELRLQIYGYLAKSIYKPLDCVHPNRFGYWPVTVFPSSLFACRTIHDEAMVLFNDRQPAVVLCRPNQQQKYCALQTALRVGCEIDRAWLQTSSCSGQDARVSPAAVDAALEKLFEKVPYGKRRSATKLPLRLRDLRHFFAQNIVRLRRDPQIYLSLWVETQPYRRFYNWYGSETSARAIAWYTSDSAGVWLLRCNLLNSPPKDDLKIRTKVTIRGDKGDKTFEMLRGFLEKGIWLRRSEDVECIPLEKAEYLQLLQGAPFD